MSAADKSKQSAAMALLTLCMNGDVHISRKAGSFLGQIIADPAPMSEAQTDWIVSLLDKAGLPPLEGGAL